MSGATQMLMANMAAGGGGGGTPVLLQSTGTEFDPFNSSRSVTFASPTTAGSAVLAVFDGSNPTTLVVTDSQSNSFTLNVNGSTSGIAIASAPNIVGGSGHQVNFAITSSANPGRILIFEVSNLATSNIFDVGGQVGATFTSNISLTTAVTAQAVEFVLGVMSSGSGGVTAGTGFTLAHTQGNVFSEGKAVSSIAAQTINFIHSERSARMSGATFKGL